MSISKNFSFFFVVIFSLLLLTGCINLEQTNTKPKQVLPKVDDVKITLLTSYSNRIEEEYVKSPGLSFRFNVKAPQKCTIAMCLNSFRSGYWKLTGDPCVVKTIEYPNADYYIDLPKGGNVILAQSLDHDITERILVNVCYDYTQTLTITGCLNKHQTCKFSIDNSNNGYLRVYNIFTKYDPLEKRYVLSFEVSYHPYNWTYITDNPEVLRGACYLSKVVSPETGDVSMKAKLLICENKCESVSKTIYLSSSGETKQVSIKLPKDIQDERNIITMILNISYIIFKQMDYGSITVLHSS